MGRATVEVLLDAGYEVTIINRGRTRNPFSHATRHICCDRNDAAAMATFLTSEPPWDAIIDFIAFEPSDAAGLQKHTGRYVVISSDSVYMACDPAYFMRSVEGRLVEGSTAKRDAVRAMEDEYGANKLALEASLGLHTFAEGASGTGTAAAEAPSGITAMSCATVALRLPDVLGNHENTGLLRRTSLYF